MPALKPAPIEGSDNGYGSSNEVVVRSMRDYIALEQYIHKLEIQLFKLKADRDALFLEFIFLLKDQPNEWRVWHIENFHRYRLPESVLTIVCQELNITLKILRCDYD